MTVTVGNPAGAVWPLDRNTTIAAPVIGLQSAMLYYPAFDFLRIILATTVAIDHARLFPFLPELGGFSVQVFFAMSGFLIGGILVKSTTRNLVRFYYNRATRIWVSYFVAIAALASASLLREPITHKWIEIFFYDLTFVFNLFGLPQVEAFRNAMPLKGTGGHFWSICAEEQFYLVAPLLMTLLPASISKTIPFWLVVAIVVLLSPLWTFFGAISLGVLAAVVQKQKGEWIENIESRSALAAFTVICAVLTYFAIVPYRVGAPITAVSIVLVLAKLGRPSDIGRLLGGISFPMYLNHWIGLFIGHALFPGSKWPGVALAIPVALVFYFCVDRIIMKYRDQIYLPRIGQVLAVGGFALISIGLIGGLILKNVGVH